MSEAYVKIFQKTWYSISVQTTIILKCKIKPVFLQKKSIQLEQDKSVFQWYQSCQNVKSFAYYHTLPNRSNFTGRNDNVLPKLIAA